LTTTARVLGVEHSTVARRVTALETTLGLRLFDRLPKSWVLTAEGEGLLDHARRIEEEAMAFSRVGDGYGAFRGTVRVSAPPVFASAFLAWQPGRLDRWDMLWEFVGYDELLRETPQQQWIEQLAGKRPFNLRTNDLATMLQACRSGLGLAALPHFLARGDSAVVQFDEYPCPIRRPIWLAIHPDVRRSARVKAVAELVTQLIEEDADILAERWPCCASCA
jgi:DNA-binding transcriptional LysR family regulator